MYASDMKIGVLHSNEQYLTLRPKYIGGDIRAGVSFVHGAGSNADYCLSPLGKQAFLTRKIASEFPAMSGDNGGPQTWGNALSIERLKDNINNMLSRPDVDSTKYALVSASMGGIVSLNYALTAPHKPKAIVSVIPVININDIFVYNRHGYGNLINSAFGGWSELTYGSRFNPHTYRDAEALKGIPMLFFYGRTDDLCLPQFMEEFAAADPEHRTLVPLASGHDWDSYDAVNHDMIVEFLMEHNR